MTNPWKPTNRLTDDTVLFDAIGKIRESSDKRREIEARVLAENNLASVRQLSEDKKKKFCAIVDALLAEQADVNVQLFPENDQNLIAAAGQIKTTTWGTITEGTEDLQELSKDTLKSYRLKAHKDIGQRVLNAHDQAQTNWKAAAAERTKVAKRAVGINRASAKMKKEEVDSVDESLYGKLRNFKTRMLGVNRAETAAHRAWEAGDKAGQLRSKAQVPAKVRAQGGHLERAKLLKTAAHLDRKSKRYDDVVAGKGVKFGTRKEDIVEAILEMEGLHSIDQLTESGLAKLDAIVEQVMIDEENEKKNLSELSKSTLARYIIKAHTSGTAAAASQENAYMKGHKRHSEQFKTAGRTGEKREQGIQRAAYKMALKKEDADLQEISQGLATRAYAKAATDDAHYNRRAAQHDANYHRIPDDFEQHVEKTADRLHAHIGRKFGKVAGLKATQAMEKKKYGRTFTSSDPNHEYEEDLQVEGTPTPNPKGAPRGERDSGDYKNPSGVPNKSVDKATLADRKLVKKNGGRFPDNNSY